MGEIRKNEEHVVLCQWCSPRLFRKFTSPKPSNGVLLWAASGSKITNVNAISTWHIHPTWCQHHPNIASKPSGRLGFYCQNNSSFQLSNSGVMFAISIAQTAKTHTRQKRVLVKKKGLGNVTCYLASQNSQAISACATSVVAILLYILSCLQILT